MKTRTRAIIDWSLLSIFCVVMFLTLKILPKIWQVSAFLLEEDVSYIPKIFIGSILLLFFLYLVFFKRQRRASSYIWFIILTVSLSFAYGHIEDPYDKMHLFEYFILSFLFFRALHHHIFSQKLYLMGAVFSMIIALLDETTQLFIANRSFSPIDIGADFTAAVLGQLSISLIVRPELEAWRFKLKLWRTKLRAEKRWLDENK